MANKQVVYVDERDLVVGAGTIEKALEKGYAVRIVRIFITNHKRKILLQQRSSNIKNYPLKWDQSAGGHVDEAESYHQAAKRELFEEMGISNIDLQQVCKYFTVEPYKDYSRKRHNVIYIGNYDGEVKIDNHEVSDYKWLSFDRLNAWINNSPDDFTNGFIDAYSRLYKLLK